MKYRGTKALAMLLTLAMVVGLVPGMGLTAYAAGTTTEELLTTITATGTEQASYNPENVATVSFSNLPNCSSSYMANWGWWGYGWSATVNAAEGYTITKCVFYDDANRTATDSEAPFVVETTEEDKTPKVNGTPILANQSKGIKKIEVYGYATPTATYEVTYRHGAGTGTDYTRTVTKVDGVYKHPVDTCTFTAPDGEHFDHWDDGKGHTYKYGDTINPVTENITLTAIWVDDSKPDSGSGGGSGSFVDLVFNIPGEDNSWEYVGGYAPQQAYRVSLAPMQGGSAALGLTTGDSGTALNVYPTTTVFVFPNANPGYVLDKIVWSLIDGSASYDITEAKNFVMPAMDVVVYVTFRPVG